MIAEAAEAVVETQWELYSDYFANGIPYGEVISAIFIIGLCAFATWKARKLYKEL